MSSTARPTLNLWLNATAAVSAYEMAEAIQQRDRRQEEQSRLHAGADPVILLLVVLESAEQKRCTEDEQCVGDDRTGN